MLASKHTLRRSLIAVLAIWGAVSASPASVEAGTGRGCEGETSLTACCTLRPEACTSSCRPVSPAVSSTAGIGVGSAEAGCNPVGCECRSSEPGAPSSKPESERRENRSDRGDGLSAAWLPYAIAPATPAGPARDESGRLRLPLHLLTTHLRF